VDDHLFQLGLGHAVGHGDVQVSTQLLGAAVGDQRRAGDQTTIRRGQLRLSPDVAEQDVVGELDQPQDEVADELSLATSSEFLRPPLRFVGPIWFWWLE
jgi:hypothetical protein